ncbi:hypothetical protein D3C76_905230 [compost metagenome]
MNIAQAIEKMLETLSVVKQLEGESTQEDDLIQGVATNLHDQIDTQTWIKKNRGDME